MRIGIHTAAIGGAVLALLLSACSTMNTKIGGALNLDTNLTLTFVADESINPDDNRRPSPLFIRMYELRAEDAFKSANFIDLYERGAEVLGGEMIAEQRLRRIIPGERRKDAYVLSPETRYVGLMAEFLEFNTAAFKVIVPVTPTNVIASSSVINLSGNAMHVKK